jgi:flagellar motility protein MotE (MotC chaperone)
MTGFIREFRLVPVVLFATICLFTLKVMGLLLEGGYILGPSSSKNNEVPATIAAPASVIATVEATPSARTGRQSWAREMFNYPDITGSVEAKAESPAAPAKPAAPAAANPPRDPGGTLVPIDGSQPSSPGERAILERLQERRQEIEARARELEIRDGLLKAAEKKLESRTAELKDLEARVSSAVQKNEGSDAGRFKDLVAMYENMKPKDAAKIFDRLELPVLVQVTSQINPRKMSDILGQMSPEAAERLTVELATRAAATEKTPTTADLPKIQGRPSGT